MSGTAQNQGSPCVCAPESTESTVVRRTRGAVLDYEAVRMALPLALRPAHRAGPKPPPREAGQPRRSFYRFKDTGGSRDTHETDTRTSQTNLRTNPTHRLTRQTTPEPRVPGRTRRPTPHHSALTRKRGGGDGDGDGARTWEQRGREPGTPVRQSTSPLTFLLWTFLARKGTGSAPHESSSCSI